MLTGQKHVLSTTHNSIRTELLLTASSLERSSALNGSSVASNGTKIRELFLIYHFILYIRLT
jgi:hypothetical protein